MIISKVNNYGLKPVAFAATGFACPPLADNFIYGFTPVELRQNIKDITIRKQATVFPKREKLFNLIKRNDKHNIPVTPGIILKELPPITSLSNKI